MGFLLSKFGLSRIKELRFLSSEGFPKGFALVILNPKVTGKNA